MITATDFSLTNALKVIFAIDDSNPIVCLQLHIRTGSVNESVPTEGYSHFIEHLTFKNTAAFPYNEISSQVTLMGGTINAYTEFDTTCYYLMLPCEKMAFGLKVLADIAFRAVFLPEDIEIEKDIIIEEIKQYANDPESGFTDWIQGSYFILNPLRNPVLGTCASVKYATPASLRNFYRKYYRPDNAFLVVTGNFVPARLRKEVDLHFSDWTAPRSKLRMIKIQDTPEYNGFRLFNKIYPNNGDYLAFILPELQSKNILSDAMLILAKAFASGKQSRLYKRLVETDKTALSIQLQSISGIHTGITIIQVVPRHPDLIPDIIYAFYDEWQKIRQRFVSAELFDLVVKELYYAWLFDFEYIESTASGLATEEIYDSYMSLFSFPDKIAKVDINSLLQCIKAYWKPDYLAIYHMGKNPLPLKIRSNVKKLFTQTLASDINPQIHIEIAPRISGVVVSPIKTNRTTFTEQDFQEVTLDNGMHLLMRKVLNKPTIGMALSSPLSQLSEPSHLRGVNYLTSGLLLFGTKGKSYDELQKACLIHGFNLKISHTLETTTLKGKCFPFSLEKMLSQAADIIQNPIFPAEHFRHFKSAILESIRRENESPFQKAYNAWSNLLLGKSTNLSRPYGDISHTKRINLTQISDWYDQYYALPNFNICFVGDIEFNQIEDLCNEYLNSVNTGGAVPDHVYRYNPAAVRVQIRKLSSDQSNLILGGLGCPSSDYSSNTAFYVLSQILGGDLSSRFFNILREKYGYAYQSGFDFTSVRDIGYWLAYVICDKKDYKEVYRLLCEILSDVRNNGVSQDELISAKNYLNGIQRFDMESLSWQANTLSVLYALDYDYAYFLNREQRLNAVDRDIIKFLAEKYLNPESTYTYLEK